MNDCVFDHIITSADLSHLEKLYYLLADCLSIINYRYGKGRGAALPYVGWAKKLSCSRSKIFELQRSLEEKGYFTILRDKNDAGQNNRNIIIPSLPKDIFDHLCDTAKYQKGNHATFDGKEEKRAYLDRTKLTIKLNYHLIKFITANESLNTFQKILWLDFYASTSAPQKAKPEKGFSLISSYQELALRHSYGNQYISRSIKALEDGGFLKTERFFIKNKSTKKAIIDNRRSDKSLWNITLTVPKQLESGIFTSHKNNSYKNNGHNDKSSTDVNSTNNSANNIIDNNDNNNNIIKENTTKEYDSSVANSQYYNQQYYSQAGLTYTYSYKINQTQNFRCLIEQKKIKTTIDNSESKSVPLINILSYNFKNRSTSKKIFFENSNDSDGGNESRSNFVKKDLEEQKEEQKEIKKITSFFRKPKELADFYPLNEQQCKELQKISNRQFDLHAMNEIFKDMIGRLKDKSFKKYQAFMNYMGKIFANEMRSENKINNTNFKIVPRNSEAARISKREEFLTKIENSTKVSPESHFKKRLAAVLNPDKAYEVLKAYRGINVKNGLFTLNLDKHINLNDTEKEVILSHAKSTHDGVIDDGIELFVNQLTVNLIQKQTPTENSKGEYEPVFEPNLWGRMRRALIDMYTTPRSGEIGGKVLDFHWFSKLNANIDEGLKLITLTAPTNFVKTYIYQNYLHHIEMLAKQVGFTINLYSDEPTTY